MSGSFDLAVVGAGTAGLPAAMAAAARGLRVVVVEKSTRIGGTLHYSSGQMSAAGTRLQRERGIEDCPDLHYADVMRISRGLANGPLVRRAVDLAPRTIDWLMEIGFEMHPSCPAILHLHEAYAIARTYWGVDGGRSILKAVVPAFEAARARGGIDLRLGTTTTRLLPGEGILARGPDGGEARIEARATILATGGYGASPAMFARLHSGMPLYTTASPTSDGSGHAMAEMLGAKLRNMHFWKPALAGIEDPAGSGRVAWEDVPALTPQVRRPWEIFVDAQGRRFVAEDHDSVDVREAALARLPGLAFWVVFDEHILREAPPLLPRFGRARLETCFATHPHFARAEGVEALSARTGIDAAGLRATIAAYNAAIAVGGGDPLGRAHMPRPIRGPVLMAVRCVGMVLRTAGGVVVDDRLRVLDAGGAPMPGLHLAGEIIGGGTMSGDGYVGGMSVTPALGFGRWLGETVLS
ncbi:MAG: FAD-dependent oxidoreductase [Alphaproteobacteria bacterium]|nr:FAD-dependent oxidoreductase [Alphaproteobacteria bacterium]